MVEEALSTCCSVVVVVVKGYFVKDCFSGGYMSIPTAFKHMKRCIAACSVRLVFRLSVHTVGVEDYLVLFYR